ncbi:MAG: NAD-dependent epimerase/dehydratase family protein [Nitrospinota bacterium]|nr:NAD-dependent epimerase/dehydratase family protein [Nitrospinota bacterium]
MFSSAIKNGKPPLIYEDGKQIRDFIHIKDLVRGKLLLLDHPRANYGVYNIGTETPSYILELAQTLINLYGKSFAPNIIHKFRNGDIRHCYADASKIKDLGFEPKISLEEGLKDLVAWGESQTAVSKVDDAHRELVAKGLVV